ncbi:hypothetical protein M407DRAFT_27227 [Tulasnella calospora MUT 4182]|uniref:Uncharacterized protein n=1 Tax=Tulasnella calospora MUT 4182 TaxID=1051891 RepID=A0A0C3QEB2_9AGAM|nr:hypothetical protein M407DRAFT_27227 [Tulasnella calospora MUT 4182]
MGSLQNFPTFRSRHRLSENSIVLVRAAGLQPRCSGGTQVLGTVQLVRTQTAEPGLNPLLPNAPKSDPALMETSTEDKSLPISATTVEKTFDGVQGRFRWTKTTGINPMDEQPPVQDYDGPGDIYFHAYPSGHQIWVFKKSQSTLGARGGSWSSADQGHTFHPVYQTYCLWIRSGDIPSWIKTASKAQYASKGRTYKGS